MTSTMTSSASSAPPALSEEVDPSLGRELPQTAFVGEPQETCRHGDLAVVGTDMTVDALAAEQAVRDLLIALGRDPEDEHLVDTPRRVAASFIELLTPERFELTTFPNEEGYDELVLVRDIPFRSLCQHHLLPFHGLAHVGYIPGDRILGLSKLARIVKLFASDLQVQERLTKQIADSLQEHLQPKGVGVVLESDHLCMSLRGVASTGSRTVTSAVHGLLRENSSTRQEFFALTPTGR